MTSPPLNSTATEPSPRQSNAPVWYRPTVSPEHGVYIMLLVSFLIGAAAAFHWTWATTLALMTAFCGFQAEHPLVVQIKQRRSLKPRLLVWGGLYSVVAIALALYLYWLQGNLQTPLLWIYLGAIAAFGIDAVSVFYREQKSVLNELITFFAVCLSTPLAYVVTTGTLATPVLGLWLLNGLFFSSAIFTVKFRKNKQHPLTPSLLYHAIASVVVAGLWAIGWLSPLTALAFSVALLKLGIILWQKEWYCTTKIQFVAMLETGTALLFLAIAALSLLPAHLPG
ncbi:YwiC-like family protein [Oscillatoria sp. FACHB-1407]|uniref:YwiC-like family protein n=1 Tax=Oscillatoria sp. FACHB-1407 TaxID=2692847 RepID=UPI001681CFC3|nr:YwiC-like family protein [Oscillatoria sp. FACHB-1407]MBD2464673.1 YwiC-like family protein [Oscillatoria sp. FACHB-1407]